MLDMPYLKRTNYQPEEGCYNQVEFSRLVKDEDLNHVIVVIPFSSAHVEV